MRARTERKRTLRTHPVGALGAPAVLFALSALAPPLLTAPPAHAAGETVRAAAGTGYRYWSFWQQKENGSWAYATEGPATQRPDDGDTLGFRFALSEDSQQAEKPRGTTTFDAACEKTAPKGGSKRVAVRIDFGTRADAPASESKAPPAPRTRCARVAENASAAEALAQVATPLRYSSDSLLCAIDHYPARGCGEQAGKGGAHDSTGAADSADSGDGSGDGSRGMSSGLGLTAGVAAVAVLGAAAFWQARRRKR